MIISGPIFEQHIIHIYLHILANLIFEDPVHQSLVGAYVLNPKGNYLVIEEPMISYKSGLIIFRYHSFFIIARECIYEGEQFVIESGIN